MKQVRGWCPLWYEIQALRLRTGSWGSFPTCLPRERPQSQRDFPVLWAAWPALPSILSLVPVPQAAERWLSE